jgi:hypothetical protein
MTEQLLNGPVSPEKSPPSGDKNEDQQPPIQPEPRDDQQPPPFVLASDLITFGDDFTLDSDSPEPEDSLLISRTEQHTLSLKDAASTVKVVCECVCVCVRVHIRTWEWYIIIILMILQENTIGWDRAVQAQLDNLKLWLELQFTALNRKIDAIVEKQRRHRKVCHVITLN